MSAPGTPPSVVVCEAVPGDVPAMVALLSVLFHQEADFVPDPARQRAGLEALLATPGRARVLVARMDGDVAGMVSLQFLTSTAEGGPAALLEDLVVAPDRRGLGIGGALLEAARAVARTAGCTRITLLTDADNAAAKRLYARCGFRESAMVPMRAVLEEGTDRNQKGTDPF